MSGYQVDVDFLRETVLKLQGITDGMDGKSQIAAYQTGLSRAQLGSPDFLEADSLHDAHVQMQTALKGMVATLQEMLQEVTDGTGSVHRRYLDQEQETVQSFRRQA
ncbi:hypothetical protein [Streptacidiphilus jiangxiensis]|uniref:Excreted virulence factor EspC, type VII ESX diderm n=1 Tax=Streptacidiphilus jiangxiensis TaxID=235985 RepID=A0A1H7MT93_STRJI|nr:hypothetical protein [Streptacidiphilus jiangxiensis]SEL14500.1 hypothetical protein SAMN05414137_10655 [Streptacidiphilus jiangxiensis]